VIVIYVNRSKTFFAKFIGLKLLCK